MSVTIGDPLARVDGKAKVSGKAKYAAEFPVPGLAYAKPVMSTIASRAHRRYGYGAGGSARRA